MSIFSFPDDNLSKNQWIFTKLGLGLIMLRFGLGLQMGKFLQFLMTLSARKKFRFSLPDDNFSKYQ